MAKRVACDILVANACVLTLDARRRVYRPGAVAIRGRDILMVGPERAVAARVQPARTLDAGGGVVHPGFVEAHYHLSAHLTRASITDDPRKPAVGGSGKAKSKAIYSRWFNAQTDEDEYASALLACLEMARNGYTSFMEPGTVFEPDAAAKAAEAIGIRGSLADTYLWDRADGTQMAAEIDRAPPRLSRCLKRLGGQLARNADPDALVRGHVAVYGSGSASEELMRAAKTCADRAGVAYTQHQNFTPSAVAAEEARLGKRPLVAYAEAGLLGPNVSYVHMNVLAEDEMRAVARAGMSVVWHPGNYLFYAVAKTTRSPMPTLWSTGVNLAFGTDVAKIWTFGDLPFIAYLAARAQGDYIPAAALLEMATRGGAKALGWEERIGSLEPGKRADLVIRRADLPESNPGTDPVLESVLVARSKGVDTVICDGQVIVKGGRSTRVDEGAVAAAARAAARRLMAKTGLSGDLAWPVIG